MENFIFRNPTEILFGRGMIAQIAGRVPKDKPILLLYGAGSIHRNGVYDQVRAALAGCKVIEFGGVEANPDYSTCMKAVRTARDNGVGFILAVGGGSVLDAGKFIAAAAVFDGPDPWEILTTVGANVRAMLPLGAVLTLPATGSESNGGSVISRREMSEKLFFQSPLAFPVFSVLDPETTFSLLPRYVRNGIVDAFAHVMEQYVTRPSRSPLQDHLAEAVAQTLVEVGPKTLADASDYDLRAAFVWSATLALNTLIGCGVPHDWATHMIGHELTAFYGLDHAETLAVVMPGVWRYKIAAKRAKLERYGRVVWGVATAEQAIEKTEVFFQSLEMPVALSHYSIDADEAAKKVEARFRERGARYGEDGDIDGAAAAAILRSRR